MLYSRMRKAKPHYTRRTAVPNQADAANESGYRRRNLIVNQPLDERDEEHEQEDHAADEISADDNVSGSYSPKQSTSFQTLPRHHAEEPNIVILNAYATEQQFNASKEVEQAVYCYANQQQRDPTTDTTSSLPNPVLITLNSCRLGRSMLKQLPLPFGKRHSQNTNQEMPNNDVLTTELELPERTEEAYYVNTIVTSQYDLEVPMAQTPRMNDSGSGVGTYKSITTFIDKCRQRSRSSSCETDFGSQETRSSKRRTWLGECCSQSLLGWLGIACLLLILIFIYISVTLTRRASNGSFGRPFNNVSSLRQKSNLDNYNESATGEAALSSTPVYTDDYWTFFSDQGNLLPTTTASSADVKFEAFRSRDALFSSDGESFQTPKSIGSQLPFSPKQWSFPSYLVPTSSPIKIMNTTRTKTFSQCDSKYANNLSYNVTTPLYPKPLLPQSRWTMCVYLLPDICRVKITFDHFIGFAGDSVQIDGKMFAGKNWNEMTIWLEVENEFKSSLSGDENQIFRSLPNQKRMQIVFTTGLQRNALKLFVQQEPCNIDNNASAFPTSQASTASNCRNQLLLNENEQTLTSAVAPYYYNVPYANNLHCRTTFSNVITRACGLNIHVNHMSIEGRPDDDCTANDYLQIADTIFCGQRKRDEAVLIRFPATQAAPQVPILWHTDASVSSTGFNISYGWIYSCRDV